MDYKAKIYDLKIEKFRKLSFEKLVKDREFKLYLGSLGFFSGEQENIFGAGTIDKDFRSSYWTKTRWKIEKIRNKTYILSPAFFEDEEIQARFALRFEKNELELRVFVETPETKRILNKIGCYKILIDYSRDGEKLKSGRIYLSNWDELSVTISNLDAFFWDQIPIYETFDLNIIHQAFNILIDSNFVSSTLLKMRANEILEIINKLIEDEEMYEAQLYIQIKALIDYADVEGDWFEKLFNKFNLIDYLYKIYHNEDDEIKAKIEYLIENKVNEGILHSLLKAFDISNTIIKQKLFWFFGCIRSRKTLLFFEKTLDFKDRELMDKIIYILLEIGSIDGYLLLFEKFSNLTLEFKLRILDKINLSVLKIHQIYDQLTSEEIYQFESIAYSLLELLKTEEDPIIRVKIIEILGFIGITKIEPLIKILDDQDSCIKAKVAEALGKIGNQEAFKPLILHLDDVSYDVQAKIIRALGELGNSKAVIPLIKKLHSENKNVIWETIISLGKLRDEKAVEHLIPFIDNPNPKIRLKVLDALEKISDPSIISHLIKTLDDDDPNIRAKTVEIFGLVGNSDSSNYLLNKLDDIQVVRLEAIRALGFLRETNALEPLINLLKSEPDNVKKEIILALGKIRNKKAVKPLLELANNLELRGTILWALSEIEDDILVKVQIKKLQKNDLKTKLEVIDELSKINSDKIIPPLIICLYDPNKKISLKAKELLNEKNFNTKYLDRY
ncbi:MAG: HEAT repeat domain-containing protein [Promethearchaeota archaeon]